MAIKDAVLGWSWKLQHPIFEHWLLAKMADVGRLFSKENIKITENMFKVEFEIQEKNVVISANPKIIVGEI